MKQIVILLAILILTACEPRDRTPGSWLSGELVHTEVDDWTFTSEHSEVFVETHPWYGIPFSVTVVMATVDGKIYVPSIYAEAADFPGSKYWNGVIARNPEVLMKIGDKRYPRRARLVTDPDEFEMALTALADKYAFWRKVKDGEGKRPPFVLICMDDPV